MTLAETKEGRRFTVRKPFLVFLLLNPNLWAVENCKLMVRTTFPDGTKKLEMILAEAASREGCRDLARERRVSGLEQGNQVTTTFSWIQKK